MDKFVFKDYNYDDARRTAFFRYEFGDGTTFEERVEFGEAGTEYDTQLLDQALFLAWVVAGTSYYRRFPTREVTFEKGSLDAWQADFFSRVYQEGMSQFAYENNLTRDDLAYFEATTERVERLVPEIVGKGAFAMQSGGKDSLLTASLLAKNGHSFTSWYVGSSASYPALIDTIGRPLTTVRRVLDREAMEATKARGGLSGHVPVTYIVASYALINAILTGKNTVLLSIGHEGEEPHDYIDDLPVNHQWSKTWPAEQALAEYVRRYMSPDLRIGSPLRGFSELKIAELFVNNAWQKYGHSFSSCNLANYRQGADNTKLTWCGECPKCANSFLLFAPFVPAEELKSLFGGRDLFESSLLVETFKGLLGIEGVIKPFECVGETGELRVAYHMAQARGGYAPLPFTVPESDFDYELSYDSQEWARQMIQ